MIARASNIAPPSGRGTRPAAADARPSRKQVEDRLRRRAGAAVARIDALGNDLAAALGKHHTAITNRKAGNGPLGDLLCEVSAWEARGWDTTSVLEALVATVEEARAQRDGTLPRALDLAVEEAAADAEEDTAQVAYLTTRAREDALRWLATLERYIPRALQQVRALRREVAA